MVGGTLMAIMGGIFYWFPKMFGYMYNETLARWSWVGIFMGFNITFFPQFILGTQGMPRRYHDYIPEYAWLNKISTFGSWFIFAGFIIGLITIILAFRKKEKAPMNPWGAKTLEWTIQSPPIHDNFEKVPTITGGPYEYR
jgi:cytochrome c oxidase subunit 1